MISAFRLVRLDGGSMFAALGASGRSLLGSLAAGVPGLIAAAAAVAGLAVVLPAAVSGMFLLAGALTAVAGAITQALLGSLLPLLPLLAGVAAGAGALFIAFKNGAKDGSKAEKVLKGMGTELKKFVRIFREDTNRLFETFASGLPQVLERIQPVIKGAFAGLQGAAEGFFRSLQTDRARRVLKELGATVENVLTPLGSLIGDTFVALSAFFNELEPYTTRMLNAFDDLMVRFGRWATSAEGKNSIKTFMDDAFLAADKVWDILGNLVGALGAVFGVSQEKAGQDFLSYLVTITEQFETFVKSADGKPKVEAFFTDVRATMVSVKDVLEELGNTLDALDTETSRQDFQTFLDVLHAFAEAARFVSAAFEPIGIALKNLDSPLKGLVEISKWAFDQLFGNSWIVDIVKGFEEWIPRIPRAIISGLAGVGERLVGPFSDAWTRLTGLLSPISERVGAFLSGIPGRIRSALASVASRFSEPFSTAKARLSARIAEIRSTVSSRVSGIPGVVSTALRGLASAFSTPFRAAWEVVSGWVSTIRRLIDSLLGKASSAKSTIGGVIANISRNIPMASGGVVYGPTNALIGEAGREAVVPLDRPLARVDKSVRGLAAIAQGRASFGSGGIAGGSSITIAEGAIVIQTSSTNPRIIAEQVIDRLTAEARR